MICPFFYVCVQTFISVAPQYFQDVWGLAPEEATRLCAVPFTVSAVLSPVFGLLADKVGRTLYFVLASTLGLAILHCMALMHWVPPMSMVICLGLLFSSCAATVWPMAALVVPSEQLGMSYGIMAAFQNTGLASASLLIASATA